MILTADPPIAYYASNYSSALLESEREQVIQFVKDSKYYLAMNLVGLVVIVIVAVCLFLAFHLLAGSVYLMTFSFPLLLIGTIVNWKRINKAKEKLRG